MNQVFRDRFALHDNPFNPDSDPDTGFKFDDHSLRGPLDIFSEAKLRKYFVEKACFKDSVDRARDFLAGRSPNEGPPVFLIQGLPDSGVESLSSYVAWLIAQHAPAGTDFQTIQLVDDSFPDWLNNIRLAVETHLDAARSAAVQPIIDRYVRSMDPSLPNENVLTNLFTALAPRLRGAAWLVLALQPITFAQKHHIERLRRLLLPLNIAPIFVTNDPDVTQYFEATVQGKGPALRLTALTLEQGVAVLQARIDVFRHRVDPAPPALFPYGRDVVEGLFADGDKVIGFLLDAWHGTLDIKRKDVQDDPAEAPEVTWDCVERYYERTLRRVAPKRKVDGRA